MNFNRKNLTALTDVARLTHIKTLVISNNAITALPKEIGLLIDLEVLNAAHNKLTNSGLPEEFFDLFQIRHLNFEDNLLESLTGFQAFRNLEKLNVASNKITELPDSLIDLQELMFLWIQNNELTKITRNVRLMSSLRNIVLLGNKSLPENIQEAVGKGFEAVKAIL